MKRIKFSDIKELFPDILLDQQELSNVALGKYYLNDGVFYNIEVYKSSEKRGKRYESHKGYYDIHIIIEGQEIISVRDISELQISESYDANRDVMFYTGDDKGKDVVMKPGKALVLEPFDAHMPGLSVESGRIDSVKKVVIKIPYKNAKKIKHLVMDVDGTLTDGKIYMSPTGEAMKAYNIKDGYGIHEVIAEHNIIPVIITGRKSEIVENRAKELGITEVHQGQYDKLSKLKEIIPDLSTVAYIGDDANDLPCIRAVKEAGGIIGSPANAIDDVKNMADYVAPHNGGDGAVRDFIDWIVEVK